MANCLQHLAATWELDLRVECVDTKRSAKHDLSLPKVRNSYLDRIRAKEFAAVLLSPPYSSFSRATWANFRGPRSAATSAPGVLETLTANIRGTRPCYPRQHLRGLLLRGRYPWWQMEVLAFWLWSNQRTWLR